MLYSLLDQKKNMCVSNYMVFKIRVGKVGIFLIFLFFF